MKASYAQLADATRGRKVHEADCPMRSPYQRDRDRLIHSNAFRRLTHKTQVFVCHEGDHYRSRLTHSIEVSQIARSIARMLRLDEDLTEAIALAHDFGHTPFGHAGERALRRVLKAYGGFDHNLQSLKIISRLEKRYPDFDGLNLSWETLEGILKHNGPVLAENSKQDGDVLLKDILADFTGKMDLRAHEYASAEAQVAALADDIAYNNHDLDDGLRGRLYKLNDLLVIPLVADILADIHKIYPTLDESRQIYELNRRLITLMVKDVVSQSKENIRRRHIVTEQDIRHSNTQIISFSDEFFRRIQELRKFLHARVYRHPHIERIMFEAEEVVENLANKFMREPDSLPEKWRRKLENEQLPGETVRNYVAGMTDRYALDLHRQLFDHTPDLR